MRKRIPAIFLAIFGLFCLWQGSPFWWICLAASAFFFLFPVWKRRAEAPVNSTIFALGLLFNTVYALIKFIAGYKLQSVWLLSLAAYYAILALLRAFLLYGRKHKEKEKAIRRLCAGLLPVLNHFLLILVLCLTVWDDAPRQSGILTLIVGLYGLWNLSVSSLSMHRQEHLAILMEAVQMSTALVSILSLAVLILPGRLAVLFGLFVCVCELILSWDAYKKSA